MLAPHNAENPEFGERRLASEKGLDTLEFFQRDSVVAQDFRSNSRDSRGGHLGKYYCRISKRESKGKSNSISPQSARRKQSSNSLRSLRPRRFNGLPGIY